MEHYSKLHSKMAAKSHFKNKVQLISLMNRVGVVLAMLLLPIYLNAQITFVEKPPVEKPKWESMRDVFMMPYDSTHIYIKNYPILEVV